MMSISRTALPARVAWCGLIAILTSIVMVTSGAIAVADVRDDGRNDGTARAMARNMYFGSDLEGVVSRPSLRQPR